MNKDCNDLSAIHAISMAVCALLLTIALASKFLIVGNHTIAPDKAIELSLLP